MQFAEIPTNSMNKTFATLKNYIKPDDYLNSVKAFFVMQDTYKEFRITISLKGHS